MSSCNLFFILILKYIISAIERSEITPRTTHSSDVDLLFHFKVDHGNIKLTLAVINLYISDGNFIVIEDILREMNSELNCSFITAAVKWIVFFVDRVLLEGNWIFVDHQEILVSNESVIPVINFGHDRVSYFDFWFSEIIFPLPIATSRSPHWKNELKWNGIISGGERLIKCENILFKLKELFSKSNFDILHDFITKPVITNNFIPMTSLLFGFNIKL